MLEKMGWKEGKGLGANEDGTTEHIKVKKKIDNQGIGTETVTHNKNWLETSVAYESILASLNASYGTKPDTTGSVPITNDLDSLSSFCFISAINLTPSQNQISIHRGEGEACREAEGRRWQTPKSVVRTLAGKPLASQADVLNAHRRYSRMLRAKDLANYSSEDKSAIFGGVPYGVAAAAQEEKVATTTIEEVKVQEVGSESEVCERQQNHATLRCARADHLVLACIRKWKRRRATRRRRSRRSPPTKRRRRIREKRRKTRKPTRSPESLPPPVP